MYVEDGGLTRRPGGGRGEGEGRQGGGRGEADGRRAGEEGGWKRKSYALGHYGGMLI